jgi:hypothetical protein
MSSAESIDGFSNQADVSLLAGRSPYRLRMEEFFQNYWQNSPITLRQIQFSSAGSFEKLPTELIHMILDLLDMESFVMFSCTSFQGKQLADGNIKYKQLIETVPSLQPFLKASKTISFHTVGTLHRALCSPNCSSCNNFGIFLYLLSAERICYSCILHNTSYGILPINRAAEALKLEPCQLQLLTTFASFAGVHLRDSLGQLSTPRIETESRRFTSVKYLVDFAIQKYGSKENLQINLQQDTSSISKLIKFEASAKSESDKLLIENEGYIHLNALHQGTMAFPSLLPSGKIERGLWCKGCAYGYSHYRKGMLDVRAMEDSLTVPYPETAPEYENYIMSYLCCLQNLERTEEDFLVHAHECLWAKYLIGPKT